MSKFRLFCHALEADFPRNDKCTHLKGPGLVATMQLRPHQSGPSWKLFAKMYPRVSYESYLGAAMLLLVDAVAVHLEGVVAGVDAHRDGAVGGDGRSESILNDST